MMRQELISNGLLKIGRGGCSDEYQKALFAISQGDVIVERL